MHTRIRNTHLRLCVLVAVAVAMFALTATAAFAAPVDDTLGVVDLQTKLDANDGMLSGYLSTVMKGSNIETIPVDVLAVTGGFADGPESSAALILFEANGPKIDKIGGIAAGMSGSPIYIYDPDDSDEPKLVGALSYGDWFTKGGTGLATPIEAMIEIEDNYTPLEITALSEPVVTENGVIDSIIISDEPESFEAQAEDGAFVAKPLSGLYVGGLHPDSRVFKEFSSRMSKKGIDVLPVAGGGLSSVTSPYNAPFAPGSAIAALASRGDLWIGGIGTVTYTSGGNVLAFGHPAFWTGETSLFMTNAWIDGIWPSDDTPYKLGRPATQRGEITQDRRSGIMGVEGSYPAETPVVATCLNLDSGKIGNSTVTIPRGVINDTSYNFDGVAEISAYLAATRVVDTWGSPGSAATTTTVVVRDIDGFEYEIVRANVVDSRYDISYSLVNDLSAILYSLHSVADSGLDKADIVSINLDSQVTGDRRNAEIVDVDVPGGLKTGDNKVTVSLLAYGIEATQTVDVTLTIPAGVPTEGSLDVYSSDLWGDGDYYYGEDMGFFFEEDYEGFGGRQSVSDAVEEQNAATPNSALTVSFRPEDAGMDEESSGFAEFDPIEATQDTDWYLTSYESKYSLPILVELWENPISYNGEAFLAGEVLGAEDGTVDVYRQYSDETSVVAVGTEPVDAEGVFMAFAPGLRKNATITLVYNGEGDVLDSQTTVHVNVRAKVTLKTSATTIKRGKNVTLAAYISPSTATGQVAFQRYSGGTWRTITTKTVSSGKATYSYRAPYGTNKLRAKYLGGATNVSGASSTMTVKVVD